jgi:hypothetical protein
MKKNASNHFPGASKSMFRSMNLRVLAISLMAAVITITAAVPAAAAPNAAKTSKTDACAASGYWTGYWTWTGTVWLWTWVWVPDRPVVVS